jgi:hypothetical protein
MLLTETSEIDRVYFQAYVGADIMATIYRESPSSPWAAVARIRLVVDDKTWASAGVKRSFRMEAQPGLTEEQQIAHLREAAEAVFTYHYDNLPPEMRLEEFPEAEIVEVQGGVEKLMEALAAQPWASAGVSRPGETPDDLRARLAAEEALTCNTETPEA